MHTVTDLTPVRVLAQMETVLDERGWCQRDFTNDDGNVCLEGAVRLVVIGEPDTLWDDMSQRQRDLLDEVESLLAQAIGRPERDPLGSPCDFGTITRWNDDPNRTVDDVRHALAVAQALAGGTS